MKYEKGISLFLEITETIAYGGSRANKNLLSKHKKLDITAYWKHYQK